MSARPAPHTLRNKTLLAVGLSVSSLFCGCSMFQKHQERKIPQYGVVDTSLPRELQKVSMPRHVIEPPDQIEVLCKPSLTQLSSETLTVQADGFVDLGLYGHYYVSGLTPEDVELKLAQALAFLPERKDEKEPLQVSVRLVDGQQSKRYYVLGTVNTANSFAIKGNETVLDAILLAGLKSYSLPEKAYLVRPHPNGAEDQVFSIDWFGITQRGDTTTNYQLLPGDRIYVPGGKPPGLVRTFLGG